MNINAEKIQNWRNQNPNETITSETLKQILKVDYLHGLDLSYANLSGAKFNNKDYFISTDFTGANLHEATFNHTDFHTCDFTGAILEETKFNYGIIKRTSFVSAQMMKAHLYHTSFFNIDFYDADLDYVNFIKVEFDKCNFTQAHMNTTHFEPRHFRHENIENLTINKTPSGDVNFYPTPHGWRIRIGCWKNKTLTDLKYLLDNPELDWPEAKGLERAMREPALRSVLALCKAHKAYHSEDVLIYLQWEE